ncbi:hypothetical protein FACS189415_8010 [Bacteroidia bacterium]|nr:hypothetical protein FACS189415_8010 [Bacteroidia bacterium]
MVIVIQHHKGNFFQGTFILKLLGQLWFYLRIIKPLQIIGNEMKAYEKVICMIAHEVNNTTAGITSTLDTLDNTLKEKENTEEISDALRIAVERCYSMKRFITNFAAVPRNRRYGKRHRQGNGKQVVQPILFHQTARTGFGSDFYPRSAAQTWLHFLDTHLSGWFDTV